MADINTQSVLQALDEDFSPSDIEAEMINQGIDPIEANTAIKTAIESQVPRMLEEGTIEEVSNFLRTEKGFTEDFIPTQIIEPITTQQLIDPIEPIVIPDPKTPSDFLQVRTPGTDFDAKEAIEQESKTTIETQEVFDDEIIKDQRLNEINNPQSEILSNINQEQLDTIIDAQLIGSVFKGIMTDIAIGAAVKEFNVKQITIEDLAAKYNNIATKYNTFKQVKGLLGNQQSKKDLAQDSAEVAEFIFQGLLTHGFDMVKIINTGPNQTIIDSNDPRYNNIYLNVDLGFKDEKGELVFITPGIIQNFNNARFEMAGAITGAIAGASIAAQIPIPPITLPTIIAKGLVIGTGALIGGATAAGTGRGLDIYFNAWQVKEEIDTLRILDQMVDAAYTDAIWTVGIGITLKAGVTVVKGLYNAALSVPSKIGISTGRAERTLQRVLNISSEQADEIVLEWAKLNTMSKNIEDISRENKLGIIVSTSRKGTNLLSSVTSRDVAVANIVTEFADKRAKGLLELSKGLKDPNITRRVIDELTDYTSGVKAAYSNIKQIGANLLKSKIFKFDYDRILYKPLERQLSQQLQNASKFDKVDRFVTTIATTSQKRDFKSLLDSRTLINDFKRANKDLDEVQVKVLTNAIKRLDNKIASEIIEVENGKEWLKAYKVAIIERDKMFKVKENILFKALTKKGTNPDQQIKSFVNLIRAEDGTYIELVSKLPRNTADKMEVEVANSLINRYTVGDISDVQAIQFPELAEEMSKYPFKAAEAKRLKSLVNQMAVVYKNDIALVRSSGRLATTAGSSGIGINLFTRAKTQLSGGIFASLTKFRPGKVAGERVLVDKLIKVLENPLDTVSIKVLAKEIEVTQGLIGKRSQTSIAKSTMTEDIKNLQIQAVKRGQIGKPDIPRTNIFKVAKVGKERVVTNGKFGFGIYYKLDKSMATKQLPTVTEETLEKITTREVPDYRLADEELISNLLGKIPKAADLKTNQSFIKIELENAGYLGYKFGEDVLLFN